MMGYPIEVAPKSKNYDNDKSNAKFHPAHGKTFATMQSKKLKKKSVLLSSIFILI